MKIYILSAVIHFIMSIMLPAKCKDEVPSIIMINNNLIHYGDTINIVIKNSTEKNIYYIVDLDAIFDDVSGPIDLDILTPISYGNTPHYKILKSNSEYRISYPTNTLAGRQADIIGNRRILFFMLRYRYEYKSSKEYELCSNQFDIIK